jgi:RND family efflux transporter MFP subunit
MNIRRPGLISAAVLLLAVVAAVTMVRLRPQPPRSDPPSRVPVVGTALAQPLSGRLTVRGSGTVRPRAEIDLAAQVSGRVAFVSPSLVSGGRVEAGEVLLRIEDADYRNAVLQARAQVAQDSVGVFEAEEEARIAEAEYEQFKKRQAERGETSEGVVAALEASRLTLRGPQLAAARAALARSGAQLADAELDLSRTEIRAPFRGVVRSESVDVGAYATLGQPLARVFSIEQLDVVVPLSDADVALLPGLWDVRAGRDSRALPARVIASFGDKLFAWDGFVDRAEAALDELSRTIDVVVRVPDPFEGGRRLVPDSAGGMTLEPGPGSGDAPPLLVGQFAEVEIKGSEGLYVTVPRRALRESDEVWVVVDGRIRIVPVRVIQRGGGMAYIEGSLDPGDLVVTDGITLATEGMEVRLRTGDAR